MELYSLNLKNYKKAYITSVTINALALIISFALVKTGHYFLPPFYATQNISRPILLLLIAGSVLSGWNYRKKIKQLDDIENFEDKIAKHEKIYKVRILWLVVNCCGSCFLYALTTHTVFFYLAIYDFVTYLLFAFPNKTVIQKELKNEEIIFL